MAESGGKPLVLVLTGSERHAQTVPPPLLEHGAVKWLGRCRPRVRRDAAGHKGYHSEKTWCYLRSRRIAAVIPTKADEAPALRFDCAAYRERNDVERLINRLKKWLHVATRYEKWAATYLAMVTIAAILLWL